MKEIKEIKAEILQGRTTKERKSEVVKYAERNKITISKAIDELVEKGLKA